MILVIKYRKESLGISEYIFPKFRNYCVTYYIVKKVLITGPTGTLGINMIYLLIQKGYEIWSVCNPNSERKQLIPNHPKVHVIESDISEFCILDKKIDEIDIVISMAWSGTVGNARNDMRKQLQNIQSTIDLFNAAKNMGVKVFVGAGSQAEYGRKKNIITETDSTNPENGYGIAKLATYLMLKTLCEDASIRLIWPRYFSVYGPFENHTSLIISTIDKLLDDDVPKFTAGEQEWDYLYVKDAVSMVVQLIENEECCGVYNICSGKSMPLKSYIMKIYSVFNEKYQKDKEPLFGDIPYSDRQVMFLCGDSQKIQRVIETNALYDFSVGIGETIDWCQSEKKRLSR